MGEKDNSDSEKEKTRAFLNREGKRKGPAERKSTFRQHKAKSSYEVTWMADVVDSPSDRSFTKHYNANESAQAKIN